MVQSQLYDNKITPQNTHKEKMQSHLNNLKTINDILNYKEKIICSGDSHVQLIAGTLIVFKL